MAVQHAIDSPYARERQRHEAHHTQFGPPGRPYQFREFPTRMYKAARNPAGKIVIVDAQTARDEHEQSNLESRGFVTGGQGAAVKAVEALEEEYATLAANRNYDVRRMSGAAQAEVAAVEAAAGARHLATIPEAPKGATRDARGQWAKERAQNGREQQEK